MQQRNKNIYKDSILDLFTIDGRNTKSSKPELVWMLGHAASHWRRQSRGSLLHHFLHSNPLKHPTTPETAAKMSQHARRGFLFLSIAFHPLSEYLRHTDRRADSCCHCRRLTLGATLVLVVSDLLELCSNFRIYDLPD